jgi:hypothetical protein
MSESIKTNRFIIECARKVYNDAPIHHQSHLATALLDAGTPRTDVRATCGKRRTDR